MDEQARNYSTLYLIGRSLLPSTMSGILCFSFSIVIIAVHWVLLSLGMGTALPGFFDGEWGIMYTNDIVQPLQTIFNNLIFNNVLVIALWGVAGLAFYFLLEYIIHMYHGWRAAEEGVQVTVERVIYHPGRRSFFAMVLWRIIVLVGAAVLFVLALSPLQRLLAADPKLVIGNITVGHATRLIALELLGWTVLAHGFVVFLRLFLLRTRLFGDPTIE